MLPNAGGLTVVELLNAGAVGAEEVLEDVILVQNSGVVDVPNEKAAVVVAAIDVLEAPKSGGMVVAVLKVEAFVVSELKVGVDVVVAK